MQEGLASFAEQYIKKEHEIMPEDFKAFYIEARANTYAGDAEPEENPTISGSKELRYDNGKFFYIDTYFDSPKRPGNFFGGEVIREGLYEGPIKIVLSYGGGLTGKGLEFGEGKVYGILQKILKEKSSEVRFGNKIQEVIFDNEGSQWTYKDDGVKEDWGWRGTETIVYNGEIVYTLTYTGGAFMEGF